MNKQLIGTLVGALILFIFQFVSWGPGQFHGAEMQYTEKQDVIMEALNNSGIEEGEYFLPNVPPEKLSEQQEIMKAHEGKPWATIQYHKSLETSMTMNLIRGFIVDLLAAFFLVWILMKFENRDMKNCILAALAVGAIGYLTIPYLETIWFKTNSMGYVIDLVLQWGLTGVFLGWYLNRK